MNIHTRQSPAQTSTTQAAEGMLRRAFTVEDTEKMVAAGIFREKERFELIGGEIVPMLSKGIPHEVVKKELNRYWIKLLSPELDMITETTLRIDQHNFREPDFIFWQRSILLKDMKAKDLLLLVEVADSSLAYDLGDKAGYYASLGIADYWVINARTLETRIHRQPDPDAKTFASITSFSHDERLTPASLPDLAVCLDDLGLKAQEA